MADLYHDPTEKQRIPWDRDVKTGYRTEEENLQALKNSTTIYVGNLSFYTKESVIWETFALVGPVKRVIMGINRTKKTPCGFCFVEYFKQEHAKSALIYLSNTALDDRIIRCDWDSGFKEGRQYGRGRTGVQIRDEMLRIDDPDRPVQRPTFQPRHNNYNQHNNPRYQSQGYNTNRGGRDGGYQRSGNSGAYRGNHRDNRGYHNQPYGGREFQDRGGNGGRYREYQDRGDNLYQGGREFQDRGGAYRGSGYGNKRRRDDDEQGYDQYAQGHERDAGYDRGYDKRYRSQHDQQVPPPPNLHIPDGGAQ